MQSNVVRALIGAAVLVVAIVLLIALKGSDDNGSSGSDATQSAAPEGPSAEPEQKGTQSTPPTIVVKNGEPVGGIARIEVNAGEQIRFRVEGDEAEEVHLHGYDIDKEIPEGGGAVEFDLPAEIEGIFEAELEGRGVQILELRVNP